MDHDHLITIAHQWLKAFNDHNLEALIVLYDDHAEHFSARLKDRQPATKGLIKGSALLRSWWSEAFLRLPSLRYELVRLTPFEDRVFMEYKRFAKGEEDLYMGEMLEIRNGKIVASSVFHR